VLPSASSGRAHPRWFWGAIGLLWLLSLGLRLWGLDRFNQLVFDEIYYVKFGSQYLAQQPLFDAHPPLAKYLIGLGIWLGEHWFFVDAVTNKASGFEVSPLSYRWLNGVVGSLIPVVSVAIGYCLTRRRSFALLCGLLVGADGFLVVESRFALLHVYLVLFGLLGQLCFLMALEVRPQRRPLWLMGAGVFFGACVSVKWNGLGYLAAPLLLWIPAYIGHIIQYWRDRWTWRRSRTSGADLTPATIRSDIKPATPPDPMIRLGRINPLVMVLVFGVIPIAVYVLQWQPHLQLNDTSLQTLHEQILGFHNRMGGNSKEVHPYCSPWYSWPMMIRPLAYLYEKSKTGVISDVHAMGNPLLWWLSTAAIATLTLGAILRSVPGPGLNNRLERLEAGVRFGLSPFLAPLDRREIWALGFIGLNYYANWLPWAKVSRCTFMYHFLGSAVYGAIALAWVLDRWLQSDQLPFSLGRITPLLDVAPEPGWRLTSLLLIGLVLLAFCFWMPIYLGLPLSELGFRMRMWLPTWI
jgi:dolichyl-phosphate-mannose-protein mannosyltransferase